VIPRLLIAGDRMPATEVAGCPDVETWRATGGAVIAYGAVVEGWHWIDMSGIARFRFGRSGGSVVARPHPSVAARLVEDAYRRAVLPLVLQVRGTEVLHASAVRSPRGVVAFCAESGTGKSTLAAALGRRGYPVWADDAIAVDTSSIPVMTARLPFRIHLRPPSVALFHGELSAAEVVGSEGSDAGVAEQLPVSALCVLRRTDRVAGAVAIEKLSRSAALPALLSHAYCFSLRNVARKRCMLSHYASLATAVPVFEIRIESGLKLLPEILAGLDVWMSTGSTG
jgi:hypothetical protein